MIFPFDSAELQTMDSQGAISTQAKGQGLWASYEVFNNTPAFWYIYDDAGGVTAVIPPWTLKQDNIRPAQIYTMKPVYSLQYSGTSAIPNTQYQFGYSFSTQPLSNSTVIPLVVTSTGDINATVTGGTLDVVITENKAGTFDVNIADNTSGNLDVNLNAAAISLNTNNSRAGGAINSIGLGSGITNYNNVVYTADALGLGAFTWCVQNSTPGTMNIYTVYAWSGASGGSSSVMIQPSTSLSAVTIDSDNSLCVSNLTIGTPKVGFAIDWSGTHPSSGTYNYEIFEYAS